MLYAWTDPHFFETGAVAGAGFSTTVGDASYLHVMLPRSLSLFLSLLLSLPLSAQDNTYALNSELCDCLTRADRQRSPNYAAECLRTTMAEYGKLIRRLFGLDVARQSDRMTYLDLAYDELTQSCPLILTLRPETEEKQLWSDMRILRSDAAVIFGSGEKNVRPDPARDIPGEAPADRLVEGRLVAAPQGNVIIIGNGRDNQLYLTLDNALLPQQKWRVGDYYRLNCREEWSAVGVALVVVAVE